MTLTLHAELQALARCPSINGHIIMGSFVPADTVDIGCLVAMEREEGGVPGKVCTIRVCVHVHVCCVRCVACMPVRVYLHTPSHVGVCISCVSCGACPVSRFLMFRFWVFCAGGHVVGAVRLSVTCDFQNHQTNDLANVTIRAAHTKSIVQIAQQLAGDASQLRHGKNADFEKSKPLLRALPTWALRVVVKLTGFIGCELGVGIPMLGVQARPFGTCMVRSGQWCPCSTVVSRWMSGCAGSATTASAPSFDCRGVCSCWLGFRSSRRSDRWDWTWRGRHTRRLLKCR